MIGTLVSRFHLPMFVDADIKLPIDLKNLEENLIAILTDKNNNKETIIIYIIIKDICIPDRFSSTV